MQNHKLETQRNKQPSNVQVKPRFYGENAFIAKTNTALYNAI